MPLGATIVVIAPDAEFRRSLAFMLEAEGCRLFLLETLSDLVTKTEGLAGLSPGKRAGGFDCIVLDEGALPAGKAGLEELQRLERPVILLVGRIKPVPHPANLALVEKPMLGGALVEAVRTAITRPASSV